jgi:glycosyltransferase involved in cell wall biosynthesis
MHEADVFVASTEFLGGLLHSHFGTPTFVNQNAVSAQAIQLSAPLFAGRRVAAPSEQLTIAYFSGWPKAHEIDLETMLVGLQRALAELPHARLRIVGHFDAASLPPAIRPQLEIAPFVPYEQLFAALSMVDLNLAPLVPNPHRRSKSAVKVLEAGLVGVPTVATDLEPYRLIRHGETGMLATTPDDWYASIMALATDPVRRRAIGGAIHEQVLAEHTTMVRAPAFATLLRIQPAAGR